MENGEKRPKLDAPGPTGLISLPPKGTSGMETDVLTDISNMIDEDADLKKALQMSLGTRFYIKKTFYVTPILSVGFRNSVSTELMNNLLENIYREKVLPLIAQP